MEPRPIGGRGGHQAGGEHPPAGAAVPTDRGQPTREAPRLPLSTRPLSERSDPARWLNRRGRRLLGRALAGAAVLAVLVLAVVVVSLLRDGGDDGDGNASSVSQADGNATRAAALEATAAALRGETPAAGAPPAATESAPTATAAPPTPSPAPPTATAEPDEAAGDPPAPADGEADGAAPEDEAADPEPTAPAARRVAIEDLLPAQSDLPEGLEQTVEGEFTEEDVAQSLDDAYGTEGEAAPRLQELGWRDGRFRTFAAPNPEEAAADQTTFLTVSVHRFGSSSAAAEALPYFAESVVTAQGLEGVEVDELGDEVRALAGAPEGVNLSVLYVRSGAYLIRIGGSSLEGDPTPDLAAVAAAILAAE